MINVSVRTYAGKLFNCTDPNIDEINIVDIAHQLSMQCRFNGATRRFFSVAEHCVIGSWLVPSECALGYLLHDASEAYIGDIVHPLKIHLDDYLELEEHLTAAIEERFDISNLTKSQRETIHACDKWSARQEGAALINDYVERYPVPIFNPVLRFDYAACGLAPDIAKEAFLRRFLDLTAD